MARAMLASTDSARHADRREGGVDQQTAERWGLHHHHRLRSPADNPIVRTLVLGLALLVAISARAGSSAATQIRASASTDRTDRGSCSQALFGLGASEMRSMWSPSAGRTSRGGSSASRERRSSHGAPSSSPGSRQEASHSSSSMHGRETRRRSLPKDLVAVSCFGERRVRAEARWRSPCLPSSPANSPTARGFEHPGS